MVNVDIYRDKSGNVVKFVVEGHAVQLRFPRLFRGIFKLFAKNTRNCRRVPGWDVICAAVSSLAQSACLGLSRIADVTAGVEMDEGYLECILPAGLDSQQRDKANVMLENMVLSLESIKEQYEEYIRINEMEV